MNMYTNSDYTDMLLTLGECNGNAKAAKRRYAEKFPGRTVPDAKTFLNLERRCRDTGTFKPKKVNSGRPRVARIPQTEENILNVVVADPTISVRNVARASNTSISSVHRVLKEQLLHPFHYRQVQELLPEDLFLRSDYCELLQARKRQSPDFLQNILFTDESTFTRQGMFNSHNSHFWADENPKVKRIRHYQHNFKLNVWASTIGNRLVAYHIFDGNLNGDVYYEFLDNRLFPLLEDLPLDLRRNMFFMHDGAPPHFSLQVRRWLNEHFPNRWIGRGADAPIHWPPRSPDLNPLDFVVWSLVKEKVYSSEINSIEELQARVENNLRMLIQEPQPFKELCFP
ncbi:uncharacterized protein LOC111692828 [Anoplophora glabripennis]|uniref:Transposable element Tc3 transposase n=1 Tax=Anoplophora glabripennis TaxID=217634 RepID=V5GRI2_ANOGL|nr:uncharacterized protein LOC111692828 [Anoplophora glabripennis]